MADLIQLKNITKTYMQGDNRIDALAGIDFSLRAGEFIAIMGPSGCGKSTFMYTLGLMAMPSTGHYKFDGKDVSKLDENTLASIRNKNIGFIFQSFNLLPKTSVLENVLLPTIYAPEGERETAKKRALDLLDKVGMSHRLDNHPNQLSGGEQQRVAIARALINEPSLILADEPTGNLDSKTADDVMNLISDLHKDGNSIAMVTHEEDIGEYAERVVRMKDGKIIS